MCTQYLISLAMHRLKTHCLSQFDLNDQGQVYKHQQSIRQMFWSLYKSLNVIGNVPFATKSSYPVHTGLLSLHIYNIQFARKLVSHYLGNNMQ